MKKRISVFLVYRRMMRAKFKNDTISLNRQIIALEKEVIKYKFERNDFKKQLEYYEAKPAYQKIQRIKRFWNMDVEE